MEVFRTGFALSKIKKPVCLFFALVTGILAITGCSPEMKLAKTYVKSHAAGPALVVFPDMVFKYNLKTDSLNLDGLSEEEKDSLLWFASDFIQNINDSAFLTQYEKGYLDGLKELGIKTYTEKNLDDFFNNDSNGFVVNVAQIQLEEQYYPYLDQIDLNGITYSHTQTLNALDINTWFEMRLVNNPEKPKVLFTENLLTDDYEGFFEQNPFTGQMQYFYHIDSLNTDKIYHDIYDLGKQYASYTFDYLLNKYLDSNLPQDLKSNRYLHYDPYRKSFYDAGENRFDEMDEPEEK